MRISKNEWEDLNKKVDDLEGSLETYNAKDLELFGYKGIYTNPHIIIVKDIIDVLTLLLKHLKLEVKKEPETTVLKKLR